MTTFLHSPFVFLASKKDTVTCAEADLRWVMFKFEANMQAARKTEYIPRA